MFRSRKSVPGQRPKVQLRSAWKSIVPQILAGPGLAIALAGCEPVQSVYPFFESKDAIFEPQLVGEWKEVKLKDEKWRLEVARADDKLNEYVVRFSVPSDSDGSREPAEVEFSFRGYLFEINGARYLDLLPKKILIKPSEETVDWQVDSGLFTAPTHTVYRASLDGDQLKLAYLDDDRVRRFVGEKDLKVATDSPAYFLLTGTTQELQSQILAKAEDEGLLDSDGFEFARQK